MTENIFFILIFKKMISFCDILLLTYEQQLLRNSPVLDIGL